MPNFNPKYSFVMPAYKAAFIKESIESILNQSYKDFELIIVDDASPEDIKTIVDQFQDKRIRYYRNEQNLGGKDLVAQWNHSLSFSNAEWFILATDDDVYEPEFLATADRLLTKYPQVDIFRGRICHFSKEDKIDSIENCLPELTSFEEFVFSLEKIVIRSGIPQYVFRRQEFENRGGFAHIPLAWGTDEITTEIMAQNGVACSQNVLLRFRDSDINISSVNKQNFEKVSACFMKTASFYTNILPLLKVEEFDKAYWTRLINKKYPFEIKHALLDMANELSVYEKVRLMPVIVNYTPYLNMRNKSTFALKMFCNDQKSGEFRV